MGSDLRAWTLDVGPHASLEAEAMSRGPTPEVRRPFLLQYDLIAFLQSAQHFGFRAVRDPNVDGNFVLAIFALRIWNLDRGFLILVVKDGAFRNLQHALVFFQDDF